MMKLKSIRLLGALLSGLCLCSVLPVLPASADAAPPDAIGGVTSGSQTVFFYNTRESGGAQAMWNEACRQKNATVTLYADWTTLDGVRFGTEGGFLYEGVICVPTGCAITIDLNGFSIDRGLEFAIENGEVLYVQEGGSLFLSDSRSGNNGKVTGGNNLDGAGGIYVEPGGELNLWGGSVTGNATETNGGGILLGGQGAGFYMTGGNVSGNTAGMNGGGLAAVDSSIKVVSGQFVKNRASGSGGGLYLQGGAAELNSCAVEANSAATGGGLCTNIGAALTLNGGSSIQKNIAHSSEIQWGGGGILAMSEAPITVSGDVTVSNNLLSNGDASNMSFYADKNAETAVNRITNGGLASGAEIGVSYTGGKSDFTFALGWTGESPFMMDTEDFTLKQKDGSLTLHRAFQGLSTRMLIWIICALVVIIAVLLTIVIVARNQNKKKKKKKRKKSAA